MVGESEGRITDQTRITRSRASVRAGVTPSSSPRQLDSERKRTTESNNGNKEEFLCCNRPFTSSRALKIHQAKMCKKESQQRRSADDQETRGSIRQESNHSPNHTTAVRQKQPEVSEKKPKINWPKACETEKYRQFDDTMSVVVAGLRGKPEWKLNKMSELLYEEGKERFGLENPKSGKEDGRKEKGGPSRRETKIAKLRAEKKKLRTRWLQACDQEKDGLKALYEELKARHRKLVREQRRLDRRKEVRKTRKEFLNDPYKFAKSLFTENKSGRLECTKEELEQHLSQTTVIQGGMRISLHFLG